MVKEGMNVHNSGDTAKMSNQLDEFQEKWNNGELPGMQSAEQSPAPVEATAEKQKVEKTFEQANADFWAEHHKEEENREKIAKVKRDIENNMIVSIDGKPVSDHMFVSVGQSYKVPSAEKSKKKFFQKLLGLFIKKG